MIFPWHSDAEPLAMLLWAIALIAFSGFPGLFLKHPGNGQRLSVALTLLAAVLGGAGALQILGGAPASRYLLDWSLPFDAGLLQADPLSALFLLPLFLAAACCSLYGLAYLPAAQQPAAEKQLTFFMGILSASMALVLVAANGVLLLVAWELMALSSWLLLMTNLKDRQVQRAGMVYLLATHTGTMALFVLFSLLRGQTGSFVLPAPHSLVAGTTLTTVMLLAALLGFGAKAGIMPLHIWLPGAHANAPSHVSALMSGIMLKVGIYGIIRVASFFPQLPLWFGWLVLGLGIVSAVTGIVLAMQQQDLKRLLACSSIENIGIVCIGLGMALVGLQSGNRLLTVLGLAGAFMHILNHALFKPLLFLGSGAIIHASGTRQINLMGGLYRSLPRTAPLFLLGCLAICGLPPLNGFVGELFLYFGAFNEGISAPLPFLACVAPLLALVGGLAVITFVKLFGSIFLGAPRDPAMAHPHEVPAAMLLPMATLAALCLLFGVNTPLLLRLVGPVISHYAMLPPELTLSLANSVPVGKLGLMNGLLLGVLLLVWLVWRLLVQRREQVQSETWGCGYLVPASRIQYTGSSFAELAGQLFSRQQGNTGQLPGRSVIFPLQARFGLQLGERILDRMIIPLFRRADWCLAWGRRTQHGHLHLYILYIFATLFTLMVWSHL